MFRQSLRTVTKINRLAGVRTYAEAAESLKLSFSMPHDEVTQVNVPAVSGQMGILANHVPIVEQLKPGVVEVLEGSNSSKFFVSGGFVSVLPESKIAITSVEAFPLDSFEPSTVKTLLAEAQKKADSSDELAAAEASIEVEVLEALSTALN
ncbi:hypothetical protein JL09_g1386 [Pichia kudriavzevii]|uniref:ATP synthase subunit delta, mitochondrial n=1 Tax=Pichia kudriavzevii TaxID=4909 RepID=A0A099P634_PICKU|nr:hypothetical protein JL09_g1386 [Pichia kudriavzevii]